jgi:hypothetical protein
LSLRKVSGGHIPIRYDTVRSIPQESAQVLHQQEQMEWIGWARLKVEAFVPRSGFIILGMHQQRSHAGNVGSLGRAQDDVLE